MVGTIPIPKLHLEYRTWIAELKFAKEEIRIFERHLEHLICRNTQVEVTAQVEHFQNRFIREKEIIDTLKHDLHGPEVQLVAFVRQLSGMDSITYGWTIMANCGNKWLLSVDCTTN